MNRASLGVDIGSVSTKGVVLSDNGDVLASDYLWTQGDPADAVRRLLRSLNTQLSGETEIYGAGTTGSARRLIGAMLNANVVKNEITAHAVGTLSRHPDARTILEIGGQDSKIILITGGVVTDYAMNTLCAAGTGAFLSAQAKRLGVELEELGDLALSSTSPSKIAARCAVFAESDMVHKAQIGHRREDLLAGLCAAVVANYLSNVGKGKNIAAPVIFQGGVSKNAGVVRAFENVLECGVRVDADSHLTGALGAAILAQRAPVRLPFDFNTADADFVTRGYECSGCANSCEVVAAFGGGKLLDSWGNRCPNGVRAVECGKLKVESCTGDAVKSA